MKLRHALIILSVVILGLSPLGPASASFFDNFDSETLATNYIGFANWNVTQGTVDLIGQPGFYDFLPGNGRYVDLDGSSSQAGYMTTKNTFGAGSYILSFDLAGSQRGDTNIVDVNFGGFATSITKNSNDPFQTYTYNVTFNTPSTLTFHNQGGDNVGALLDNVSVSSVPVPPSAILLGSGLLGLVGLRRFRKS